MKTETVISTHAVERLGALSIVRVVDFAKLAAESEDERISLEALESGGDWGVRVDPSGRDRESVMYPAANQECASAFVAGVEAASDLRKRATPASTSDFDPSTIRRGADLTELTKVQTCAVCTHLGIEYKSQSRKADIAALLKGKLPK